MSASRQGINASPDDLFVPRQGYENKVTAGTDATIANAL